MANKQSKRLNLDTTTAPAPVTFNPNVPDINIIRQFRDYYAAAGTDENDKPLTTQRSDLDLWNQYAVIRQQYPTATSDDWYKSLVKRVFETDNTVTQTELPSGRRLPKAAQDVVDVLNSDPDFTQLTSEAVEARVVLQSVELQFLTRVLSDFATCGNTPWSLEQQAAHPEFICPMLDALPEPGSKEAGKKDRKSGKLGFDAEGNELKVKPVNGFDLRWIHEDGEDKLSSIYRDMACTFPEGQRLVADIRAVEEAKKSNTGRFKDNSTEYLTGYLDRLKGHLSDVVGWLRSAVSIVRQMQAVNRMKELNCYLITSRQTLTVAAGETPKTEILIVPGTTVMWIAERRAGGDKRGKTLQEFMKYRPAIAEEKGGTLSELAISEKPAEKREPNSGTGNVTAKIESVTAINIAFVAEAFAKYVHDSVITIQRTLNDPDHTKSDALLFALANIRIDLDAMFASHPDYVKRADDGLEHGGKFLAEFGMGSKPQDPKLVAAFKQ